MDTVAAVRMAASHHAALVLISDSYASDKGKGVRLEHIQQSKMEQRMAMRCCQLLLISLPAWKSAWISRLRERISYWRSGHRRRVLRERVGQEGALTGHAEVPDLERESTGRRRHRA
jgi:hypothetical protein